MPLLKTTRLQTTLAMTFQPIYSSKNVIIKCEAVDVYKFASYCLYKSNCSGKPRVGLVL